MKEKSDQASLTHIDKRGKAHMVDVTAKTPTVRIARASGRVNMNAHTLGAVRKNEVAKGDVLAVARVAGIMAAKHTSDLIPLCHGLPISSIDVSFTIDPVERCIQIWSECRTEAKTGVEMEALTAVSVAALTIYDMCKASDRRMEITDIHLVYKSGGRSGTYEYDPDLRGSPVQDHAI